MRHLQRLKSKISRRPASSEKSGPQQAHTATDTSKSSPQRANPGPLESTEPIIEKRGLFKLADENPDASGSGNYSVDIVAVHGLNGDAFSTWRHHPDETL